MSAVKRPLHFVWPCPYKPRHFAGATQDETYAHMDECPHAAGARCPTPDRCWRCDASPAVCDLGLCEPCREDLT